MRGKARNTIEFVGVLTALNVIEACRKTAKILAKEKIKQKYNYKRIKK